MQKHILNQVEYESVKENIEYQTNGEFSLLPIETGSRYINHNDNDNTITMRIGDNTAIIHFDDRFKMMVNSYEQENDNNYIEFNIRNERISYPYGIRKTAPVYFLLQKGDILTILPRIRIDNLTVDLEILSPDPL